MPSPHKAERWDCGDATMSATEKRTTLEQLDPRYPLLAEYFERGWWLIKLHGIADTSTTEQPICLCKDGERCSSPGKASHGSYKLETGTAYVRSLEEAVRKLPPGERWNVAHAFGYGSGAEEVALDIESDTALEQIRAEYGFDPLTAGAWASTGRGYHALYRLTREQLDRKAELGIEQGAGNWAVPEVDVRVGGTNGYIAIEPSVHYSGQPYKWQKLGDLTEPPAGFLELMATHRKLHAAAKEKPKPKPKASTEVIDHSYYRANQLLEAVSAKVTGASSNRNDAVKDAAYALGGALCEWPESEQHPYREKLKEAAKAQTPAEDRDYAERQNTVEESWKAGRARGSNDPIPVPGVVPTVSLKPIHDTGEKTDGETFQAGMRWKRLSDVGPPQRVEWLEGDISEGRIPRGELTLIMGEPGVGKGSITAQIVAEVTNAGRVVIISAPEDSLESVTLPRYMAAGAILENVITVGIATEEDEPLSPVDVKEHHSELLAIAFETNAACIVLDPLEEHLTADAKSERETRQALRQLLAGCRALGCALLGIDHVNRMNSSNAFSRAGGSSAKYKVARSVLIAGRQGSAGDDKDSAEQSPNTRTVALIPAKLNVGAAAQGLRFELVTAYVAGENGAQVSTAVARLLGETTLTAEEMLGEDARESRETVSECAEWLLGYLTHRGLGHGQEETRKDARAINQDWNAKILELATKQHGGKCSPMSFGGPYAYKLPGWVPLGADRN